ncbi:MAG: PQQ-binding-like beta-propeller repeat protein [Planctomycetes bacterium]|nr:PQQ-binding-like beta-propeller repeat protein [Planctomycetota bacterium]
MGMARPVLMAVYAAFGFALLLSPDGEALTFFPQEKAAKPWGARNEVRRWSYEFSNDVQLPKSAIPERGAGDFPCLPAYAKIDERDYVVFSGGGTMVAVDPTRVGANPADPDEGIHWKLPETKPFALRENKIEPQVGRSRPFLGVAIDGTHAFATLYSRRPVRAGVAEPIVRTQRMVCIHVAERRVLWDTDVEGWWEAARKRNLWIIERGFSFCGPPVVAGDRVYAGISAYREEEEESQVLCLDRRTGLPVWERLVAAVTGKRHGPFDARPATRLTLIAEKGGVIFAHSNLGVVAAVDATTGAIRWMSKYPRGEDKGRHVSPLVLHRGKIYALPQDQDELQVFDMATGDAAKLTVPTSGQRPFNWKNIVRMIGEHGDKLVLGGGGNRYGMESIVMRLTDSPQKDERGEPRYPAGTWHRLVESNVQRSGLGTIHDGLVYLPTCVAGRNEKGALAIFDGVTWRWVNDPREAEWREPNGHGNLLVAGRYLVVAAATKLNIYTHAAK